MSSGVGCQSAMVADEKCKCGAHYGMFGHYEFEAEFHCPTCDKVVTIKACQAWPIVIKPCPHCGVEHEWTLTEQITRYSLR